MPAKHVQDAHGQDLPFTLSNSGFKTDVSKGLQHGDSLTRGSVFSGPLARGLGANLWLEHAISRDGDPYYWLVWYDDEGEATIPMSAVFRKDQLVEMVRQFAEFVPE